MFGFRPDGKKLKKGVDPITRLAPYIMTQRNDALCYCTQYLDYTAANRWLRKKRQEGHNISFMSLLISAWIRTASQYPELNRFVVGKTMYARTELCVCFVALKSNNRDDFSETTVKIFLDPSYTVYEVAKKVEEAIELNRFLENSNATDKLVSFFLGIPGFMSIIIGFLKFLDRFGLAPKVLLDASPFHTSMWITNMGSIGMRELYHHIYNFGTATMFLGLGKREARLKVSPGGALSHHYYYPLGIVTDERVAPGSLNSMALVYLKKLIKHPEELETPPESVRFDYGAEYKIKE